MPTLAYNNLQETKKQKLNSDFIKYLDEYEVGLALNHLEKFFWNFCDNYIEIVKHRLYRPEEFGDIPRYSGQKTVYTILYKLLQDFSIYFPYITEEIYQELYYDNKSIHITEIKPLEYNFESEIKNGDLMVDIISQARGEKSNNNLKLFGEEIATHLGHKIDSGEKNIRVITPAMRLGSGLSSFASTHPDNFLDVGIAEENAVTCASGMALKNIKPFVFIY